MVVNQIMPMKVNRNWYLYIGPEPGRGEKHLVILDYDKTIITWSALSSVASGGWSWMGPRDDFYRQFAPCHEPQ